MADEKLVLERTIELLVVAGHVTQEKVEEARKLAISLTKETVEQFAAPDPADLAACQRDMDETGYRLAAEEDVNPLGG